MHDLPMTWFHQRGTHGLSDKFPENDGRGGTSLEAAQLPEGYLNISHLLDVTRQAWEARRAPNL